MRIFLIDDKKLADAIAKSGTSLTESSELPVQSTR